MRKDSVVLVTGSTGLLGGYLLAELARRGTTTIACGGPGRGERGVDLTDAEAVRSLVAKVQPKVVIHAAALTLMSDCARDPERARAVNVSATANLAEACRANDARLVHVSTDLVFDGEHAPYDESAAPAPLSVYGRTKLAAEREVAERTARHVIVRTTLLFGPTLTERRGFFEQQLDVLRKGEARLRLFDDEWRTPLSLRTAAEALGAIAVESDLIGVTFHLGGPERMTRLEMGERLARHIGVDPAAAFERASRLDVAGEPRPRDVSVDSAAFRSAFPDVVFDDFEAECGRMGVR
jgi:dTDP-4-dehydrorhamnose reductase